MRALRLCRPEYEVLGNAFHFLVNLQAEKLRKFCQAMVQTHILGRHDAL